MPDNSSTILRLTKTTHLPQPWQKPIAHAQIKTMPTDFVVEEMIDIDLADTGEHLWLKVQKSGMNTDFVAGLLAKWAGIPKRDVGFSGLKDRHAMTTQWFSLRLPTKAMPNSPFEFSNHDGEFAVVLTQRWHSKKLNRGTHKHNRFALTLRDIQLAEGYTKNDVDELLARIQQYGVPNYFGEQRFGHDGNNLTQALNWFERMNDDSVESHRSNPQGRNNKRGKKNKEDDKQSLWLSAARSAIFNQILAHRVKDGSWQTGLDGEVFNLAGSGSVFVSEQIDDELRTRLTNGDIHPTGAMWGVGMTDGTAKPQPMQDALLLEQSTTKSDEFLRAAATGLEKQGIKPARRALRLMVQDLSWQWKNEDTLELNFTLTTGSFATSLLSALIVA